MATSSLPVVDISALMSGGGDTRDVAARIRGACRRFGFFYIVGHGVDPALQSRLERLSRQFFAQPLEKKLAIRMELGGRAWRGYFPVGGELTSGKPDLKEGLYFGAELASDHPKVAAGIPLHGRNLFDEEIPRFRETVLDYMAALTRVGHALMAGMAISLGLEPSYFADRYTGDPLILFRIFNYPRTRASETGEISWGVGEHTDYGFLTILRQDDTAGLQVKAPDGWIDAVPIPGSFVCNIGDMLDRITGGFYRSTPHRVRNRGERDRLSFPFFFDPGFDAEIERIVPAGVAEDERLHDDWQVRWDGASVHDFRGTYGDYILAKVSKVFPDLSRGGES
jgi:isopenicillin N synthase-like dioxygenase